MSDDDVKDLVYEALREYGFQSVAVWKDEEDTSTTSTDTTD